MKESHYKDIDSDVADIEDKILYADIRKHRFSLKDPAYIHNNLLNSHDDML